MSSLKHNFFYNIAYQILLIILPLVTAPYLSRVLGAEQLGEYSFTYSTANYFVLFAMLGVNNYGNRCIARVRGDRWRLSKEFWSIYAFQATATVLMCALYISYAVNASEGVVIALSWVPYVLSAGFDVNWLFFGLEEFRLTVVRNFIVKLATFVLTIMLVRGENALLVYCLLMSVSFLVSAFVLWPFVWREVDFVQPTLRGMLAHLKPNLVLFVPVVAISLYTVMDKVMLGWLSASFAENGYFENAYKVATMPTAVVTALGTVMLPRVTNMLAHGDREGAHRYLGTSMWAAMAMSFAFAFGVAGVAPVLVPVFFGDGFEPCEAAMCAIVADMPFMAWANVIRTQLLIPEGRDKEYVASVVAGAAVNIAVNITLIPSLGALGAAIGTFCAEATVCLVQTWAVKGEVPQGRWLLDAFPFVAIGGVMCIVVRIMGEVLGTSVTTLALQVLTGAVLFSTLALIWCIATGNEHYNHSVRPMLKWLTVKVGRAVHR